MQYTAIMNKILTALTLMLAAGLAGCSKDDGANVPITGISIAETKTVQIGQTVQLTVTVMPERDGKAGLRMEQLRFRSGDRRRVGQRNGA